MIASHGGGARPGRNERLRWLSVSFGLAWIAIAVPARVHAHAEPFSFVDIHVDHGAVHGRLTAHVVDLAHEASFAEPESLFALEFVERHRAALEQVLTTHVHLSADGRAVAPQWGAATMVRERKSVAFEWTATIRDPIILELAGPLFPYDPPHETYVNVYVDDNLAHQDLLDHDHTRATYTVGTRQSAWNVVTTFLVQGIHHIFIGPDHILFVVGLLLLGGRLLRLLKIVTAFSCAHTITLVLATLQIVNPPPRIIEPAIALSIVYIGVETLLAAGRGRDVRARIAFLFGLVHGFGFASVLREFGLPSSALGWALGSFNVGVEVGQACIVLAVAPLLMWVRRSSPRASQRLVTAMSLVIIAAGAYWFVQRILAA